jgi:hypothetical protein
MQAVSKFMGLGAAQAAGGYTAAALKAGDKAITGQVGGSPNVELRDINGNILERISNGESVEVIQTGVFVNYKGRTGFVNAASLTKQAAEEKIWLPDDQKINKESGDDWTLRGLTNDNIDCLKKLATIFDEKALRVRGVLTHQGEFHVGMEILDKDGRISPPDQNLVEQVVTAMNDAQPSIAVKVAGRAGSLSKPMIKITDRARFLTPQCSGAIGHSLAGSKASAQSVAASAASR